MRGPHTSFSCKEVALLKQLKSDNKSKYIEKVLAVGGDDLGSRRASAGRVVEELFKEKALVRSGPGLVFKTKKRYISFLVKEEMCTRKQARSRWSRAEKNPEIPREKSMTGLLMLPVEADKKVGGVCKGC